MRPVRRWLPTWKGGAGVAETRVDVRLDAIAWEGLDDDSEALLAEWSVRVGDVVSPGQEIALAELVKASVPVVAPRGGRVVEQQVPAGASFRRDAVLARIEA